ncbi:nucleotide synthetase [Phenylobacterium sp.]|uniref:nucleotide synthetase n=1 Tax=Phenylobacterium sp. TaxID=1871053 RepID=UPI002C16B0A8|nr:nucleotide synthetase [Phenylobacterium sp.]HVI34030.1 nucleotide synthetase [Phenylobacterium sp.]
MDDRSEAFPGNAFKTLPTALPTDFSPKSIVHLILTTKERDDDGPEPEEQKTLRGDESEQLKPKWLRFYVAEPRRAPPSDPSKIHDYALEVAGESLDRGRKEPQSPYDVFVKEQCWVLLELARDLKNWQFTRGERAITTKEDYLDSNCALTHVSGSGAGAPGAVNEDDGCRVAYFAVVRRGTVVPGSDPPAEVPFHQYFNLHVEFIQKHKDEDAVRRLKVIFDPDVGNTGQFPIP